MFPVDTGDRLPESTLCARKAIFGVLDLLRNPRVSKSANAKSPLENLVHNLVHTVANHHTQLESRHT